MKLSDGLLRPSDIRVRFSGKRQRPLIFINACHGGRAEFSFTGLGDWTERMVNAPAGAFIGAMWEVSDRLSSGQPLPYSSLSAKHEIWEKIFPF